MIEATCHCGRVTLALETAPTEATDCNCSICRRYGVLWAYYSPKEVHIRSGETGTDTYSWGDKNLAFHRCPGCGCVTHWSAFDPSRDRMGVNARLMPPEVLEHARVRHFDGAKTWKCTD